MSKHILKFSMWFLGASFFIFITFNQASASEEFIIDYEDLTRFDQAIDAVRSGADPKEIFLDYYKNGGQGLQSWMNRWGASPERLADVISNRIVLHPDWAQVIYGMRSKIEPLEEDLRKYYSNLQQLYPQKPGPILPTYFTVVTLTGSGSWELKGSFITIGPISNKPGKNLSEINPGEAVSDYVEPILNPQDFLQIAVHEMVHFYQLIEQGRPAYIEMYFYPEKDTLIARAVREGVADFITYLASGLTFGNQNELLGRSAYFLNNEKKIWALFEPVLYQSANDNPGWFDGSHPEKPDLPFQIGYSLGSAMAASYYEQAEDKDAAIAELLLANSDEDFAKIIKTYKAKLAK